MAIPRFFFACAAAFAILGTICLMILVFSNLSMLYGFAATLFYGIALLSSMIGIISYFGARAFKDPT